MGCGACVTPRSASRTSAAITKALRKRAAAGGIGAIYLYLAYKAVRIVLDGHAGASNTQQQADSVLDLPGGAVGAGSRRAFASRSRCDATLQGGHRLVHAPAQRDHP